MNTSDIDVEEIITNLKATITSNKGGVSLNNLESDYFNITGEPLPYRKLGYNSLIEFIQSFKVFRIEKQTYDTVVYVLNGIKTKHLTEMIKKQKTAKKPKHKKPIVFKNNTLKSNSNNNMYSMHSRYKEKTQTSGKYISSASCSANTVYSKNLHISDNKGSRLVNSNQKESKTIEDELKKTVDKKFVSHPLHYSEPLNLKISQMVLENKCKKTVSVSAIYSPSSVWVLIVNDENNERLSKMQKELNLNMATNDQNPINDVMVDHYYALYHQEKWHRVVVKCIDFDGTVLCFLIDSGKSTHANRNQIYQLESKFFSIRGQAMEVVLNKLKSINDFPFINDILVETLLNKQFILIPNSLITHPLTITLYDVVTKMNVNDLMKKTFYDKVTPNFYFKCNNIIEKAEVLSIQNGFCYLLKNRDLMKSLENLLSTNFSSDLHLKCRQKINFENIFLATYKQNIKGRVIVVHHIHPSQVKVYFIDYGLYSIVGEKELIDLQTIDSLIAHIPYQAVKVTLHLFPPQNLTSEIVDMFFDILKNNTLVSVFLLEDFHREIPCVQLLSETFPNTYINIILYSRIGNLKKKILKP